MTGGSKHGHVTLLVARIGERFFTPHESVYPIGGVVFKYQLTFADKCSAARLKLDAFDCGCYGETGKDLYAFRLPDDVTEERFRQELESDVLHACRSVSRPAS